MNKLLSILALIITTNCWAQSEFLNPGLKIRTCKFNVIAKTRSKVVCIKKDGNKVFGRINKMDSNSITINSRRHKNANVKLTEIAQLRIRRFGLPQAPYIKFVADIFPAFLIWHIATSKRFYFNNSNKKAKAKKKVISYSVIEIEPLPKVYGKDKQCSQ